MLDFSSFDIYKILSPLTNGYLFAILTNTEEGPSYRYYSITEGPNNTHTLCKPIDVVNILRAPNSQMVEINGNEQELLIFQQVLESVLQKPIIPMKKNGYFMNITPNDIQFLKTC